MSDRSQISRLRNMLDERDQGRSELQDEFSSARQDDASIIHENAHLRAETDIDRNQDGRRPAREQDSTFKPVLAEKGQLTQEFDPAGRDDATKSFEVRPRDQEQQSGSGMVEAAGPRMEPRPSQEIEKPVTRESFARRWADEMARHGLSLDSDASQEHEQGREHDQERTLDRER